MSDHLRRCASDGCLDGPPFLTEETDARIVARIWRDFGAGMARKSRKCWNGAMLTTTFGYLDSADRVWLSLGDEPRRVWLTRRIAAHLLVGMAHQLEVSTPGAMAGADASTRARIEHQLAFNEDSGGGLPTAPADVPIRLGEESRAVSREASYVLCTGLHATLHPDGVCTVHLALEDGEDRVL
ncbi:MAG: hypothetical protein WCS60_09865, partial [Hydrogenophaga sp.]